MSETIPTPTPFEREIDEASRFNPASVLQPARVPVYIEGDLTSAELDALFAAAGFRLHSEGHHLTATRIPEVKP